MSIEKVVSLTTASGNVGYRPGQHLDVYSSEGGLKTCVRVVQSFSNVVIFRSLRWHERLWVWLRSKVRRSR